MNLQVLPVFMVTSSAATKSVNTASILSKPAMTFIMSELGFVYFFGRTDARNAVTVYDISICLIWEVSSAYIKSMGICWSTSCFDARHRPGKQLSCLPLKYSQSLCLASVELSLPEDAANPLDSMQEGAFARLPYLVSEGRTLSKSLLISRYRLHPDKNISNTFSLSPPWKLPTLNKASYSLTTFC